MIINKLFSIFIVVEDIVALHCTKLSFCYQIKSTISLKDLKNVMVNNFKFDTKHEWFVYSSLSWLRSIKCYLNPISSFEFNLEVFSE